MPLDFPPSPSPNDTYTFGGKTWIWTGEYWRLNSSGAINNIPIGNVTANTGNFTTLSVQTGVASDLTPTANITYDLGSNNYRWNDLWLANSTIYIGNGTISANTTSLILTNPNGEPFTPGGGGGGTTTVSGSPPEGAAQGDIWIDSDTAIQYIYFNDGNSSQWAEMEAQNNYSTTANFGSIDSNVLPAANTTYDLGSAVKRWNELWLSNSAIHLGEVSISADGNSLALPATVEIGNITLSDSAGNLAVAAPITANAATVTGNISAGNVLTDGYYYANGAPFQPSTGTSDAYAWFIS
jgi:hypothetical protein